LYSAQLVTFIDFFAMWWRRSSLCLLGMGWRESRKPESYVNARSMQQRPFDAAASEAYAVLRARAQGKAIAPADGYIAATATSHGLIVATRDTGPFEAAGLTVINPWNTQH
jgi:predicted nucleic acid-binding protein